MVAVDRFAGGVLTGIQDLKGKHKNARVVVCGSGTTLNDLDMRDIPDSWVVVAVNEAIRKIGARADYWVLSDDPIVRGYAQYCPKSVTILAMHQATVTIKVAKPHNKVYTVNSINVVSTPNDGFNFFSRGTVLIGAVEMLRYAGATRFYCFGLDCYRTEKEYYYDGRKPPMVTEQQCRAEEMSRGVPPGVRIYVTSRLKNMIRKLGDLKKGGLWDELHIHCVNSPYSQQDVIPKMTIDEYLDAIQKEEQSRKRSERRKRAKSEKALREKPSAAETKVAEEPGPPVVPGGTTDSDGQENAPVVDRGSGGGEHAEASRESPADDSGGDRDAHSEDVADGDARPQESGDDGKVPDS